MRWDALFSDLEAQLDAVEAAELDAEVRDRSRGEAARLRLVDRLAPALGHPLTVRLLGTGAVQGTLLASAPEWLLLADGPSEVLVPMAAVLTISGLGSQSTEPESQSLVEARLTLGYALRGLARSRAGVNLVQVDGASVYGTVERVGADFVEVSEHPPGEARRRGLVHAVRTIPLTAVAAVRSV